MVRENSDVSVTIWDVVLGELELRYQVRRCHNSKNEKGPEPALSWRLWEWGERNNSGSGLLCLRINLFDIMAISNNNRNKYLGHCLV